MTVGPAGDLSCTPLASGPGHEDQGPNAGVWATAFCRSVPAFSVGAESVAIVHSPRKDKGKKPLV